MRACIAVDIPRWGRGERSRKWEKEDDDDDSMMHPNNKTKINDIKLKVSQIWKELLKLLIRQKILSCYITHTRRELFGGKGLMLMISSWKCRGKKSQPIGEKQCVKVLMRADLGETKCIHTHFIYISKSISFQIILWNWISHYRLWIMQVEEKGRWPILTLPLHECIGIPNSIWETGVVRSVLANVKNDGECTVTPLAIFTETSQC